MRHSALLPLALAAALLGPGLAGDARAAGGPDRIVVITDSHGVLDFGEGLEKWLQGRADTTYDFFASGASAPRQWVQTRYTTPCGFHQASGAAPMKARRCYEEKTPHLDELWAAQGLVPATVRKVTIIAHGTNYPMTGKADEVAVTKSLIKVAFAQSQVCIWVGPPNMTRKPGYDKDAVEYKYGIIREAIDAVAAETGRRCQLIDSRPLSTYPKEGGDGIHYQWLHTKDPVSLGEGAKWATGVAERLEALLQ